MTRGGVTVDVGQRSAIAMRKVDRPREVDSITFGRSAERGGRRVGGRK